MRLWLVFLLWFSLVLGSSPAYSSLQCTAFLEPQAKHQVSTAFRPDKPIRFMSLNTLNLYLHQGKYKWTENGFEKLNQDHLPRQKPEKHTEALANIIVETQPDFIMLQEVEGYDSLDRFNRRYLGSAYKAFLPKTNDTRGIGVAFLVRNGTGVTVKRHSYLDRKWLNKKGIEEPIFSRNFPVFEIYMDGSKEPKLIVAGVHYKSRIDRPKDPRSFYKREREVEESVSILKELKEKHSGTEIVVMGDFNSSPEQKELGAFYEELKMVDAHAVNEAFQDPHGLGRSTFVYFPHDGQAKKERAFDLALMTPGLAESLISSSVYRYKDPEAGETLPMPNSIEERNEKPSDHYPILFDLAPDILYSDYKAED